MCRCLMLPETWRGSVLCYYVSYILLHCYWEKDRRVCAEQKHAHSIFIMSSLNNVLGSKWHVPLFGCPVVSTRENRVTQNLSQTTHHWTPPDMYVRYEGPIIGNSNVVEGGNPAGGRTLEHRNLVKLCRCCSVVRWNHPVVPLVSKWSILSTIKMETAVTIVTIITRNSGTVTNCAMCIHKDTSAEVNAMPMENVCNGVRDWAVKCV